MSMKIIVLQEVKKKIVRFYAVTPIISEIKDKPLEVQLKTKLKLIGEYQGLSLEELVKKVLNANTLWLKEVRKVKER